MNLVTIASKSIRQRLLASSLTALSVGLGVTLMVAVLVINGIVERMFNQTASGYDLIVGPKGSALQLVLNTVYRVSTPIENLPYRYYRELKEDKRIAEAIPFALGDVTQEGGFPIVGTISRYFEIDYVPKKKFRIRGAKMTNEFDAVIGSQVARTNGWDLGAEFSLVHGGADVGHVHDEKFTVVAVMDATGTPNDKTVFVNLDGFYLIEGHDKPLEDAIKREKDFFGEDVDEEAIREQVRKAKENGHMHDGHLHVELIEAQKEVTAVLVIMKGGDDIGVRIFRMQQFQGELKEGLKAQAVNPVQQIAWLMENVVGNVRTMLIAMTALIIAVSGVGIFVSIYNSMADRRQEIAIMRALGAQRKTVFAIVLAESILLCVAGGLLGLVLGHGLVFIAAPIVEARSGILIDPRAVEPMEFVLLPILMVLASLVGFIPGMTAYRTDVAEALNG